MAQREYPAHPLVGVGAVIVDAAGLVLLVKRGSEPMLGRWSIPGGLVELGETLLDAVRREVAEETGLSIQPESVVEVVDRIHLDEKADEETSSAVRYHYVIVDYWCRVVEGYAKAASDAADLRWASPLEWRDTDVYGLEALTIQVIEKGWHMAMAAGAHG